MWKENENSLAQKSFLFPSEVRRALLRTTFGLATRATANLKAYSPKNRFPATKVVVDASQLTYQGELVKALKVRNVEIVLDTKAAELAELGKYSGRAANTPWARDGGMLLPDHFDPSSPADVVGHIVRVAVKYNFDAVLAPCHLLRGGTADPWFHTDRVNCERLRARLDREGGSEIAIDYCLLVQHTLLRDEAVRGAFISQLGDLPFDNLWIRASGFSADGKPAGVRHYINALSGFHNLGKPIIADHLGGLAGRATLAFGAASGLAHGITERERFVTSGWNKPPRKAEKNQKMGRATRLRIPGIDRSLTIPELEALAGARRGHSLVVCQDRECCPHGLDDMKTNWKAHTPRQQFSSVEKLQKIPDLRRAYEFLRTEMADADRLARQIMALSPVLTKLKPKGTESHIEANDKFVNRLRTYSHHNEKLRVVLEDLHDVRGDDHARIPPAISRTKPVSQNRRP